MRKPKVACFRYKRHNDIYVSNVSFSTDVLRSILDAFPEQKIFILIESDATYVQTLSSIGKNIGIAETMPKPYASRFTAVCKKAELLCMLNRANMDDFEGMFIASISNDIMLHRFIYSLDHTVQSMVKDGISDISLSINFPENQMVISLLKEKYAVMSIKDKLCNVFGN